MRDQNQTILILLNRIEGLAKEIEFLELNIGYSSSRTSNRRIDLHLYLRLERLVNHITERVKRATEMLQAAVGLEANRRNGITSEVSSDKSVIEYVERSMKTITADLVELSGLMAVAAKY